MKTHIKQPSCDQLNRCSKNKSKYKNHSFTHLMSTTLNRIKQGKNREHTKAIYRADRSVQKSSVYYFSKRNCMKNNFNYPSSKRIDQEIQAYLKIRHSTNHCLFLLFHFQYK